MALPNTTALRLALCSLAPPSSSASLCHISRTTPCRWTRSLQLWDSSITLGQRDTSVQHSPSIPGNKPASRSPVCMCLLVLQITSCKFFFGFFSYLCFPPPWEPLCGHTFSLGDFYNSREVEDLGVAQQTESLKILNVH